MKDVLRRTVATELAVVLTCTLLWGARLPWREDPEVARSLERECETEVRRLETLIESVQQVVDPLHTRRLRERELPELMSTLGKAASRCGFELELLMPGGIRRDERSDVASIEVRFEQPFGNVVRYLRALEALPYLCGLQAMEIASRPAGGPLSVRIAIDVYLAPEAADRRP